MLYTKELAKKLLELLPEDKKFVAVDESGQVHLFFEEPRSFDSGWYPNRQDGWCVLIGHYEYTGDWKDTLVGRD